MCTKSGMSFSGSGDLKKNERTTQKRNYLSAQSVERGAQFRWLEVTWEFHERTHTGERAFKCTKCDNRFSSSSNLENYKRIPTVGKLWAQCLALAAHQDLVNWRDMKGPHRRETKCRKCGKSFSESGGLKKHKRTLNWWNFMRALGREGIQVHQMWQYFFVK